MSKCLNCGIEILDETDRCPLCNSVLEYTVEVENMYPDVKVKTRKMMLFSRIYLFLAIITEAILIYFNIVRKAESWWCIIPGLIMVYGYLVIRYAILGRSGYRSKVFVLVLLAVLMLVAIDFVGGYNGWSIDYVVPSVIIAIDAGVIVLMLVNRRNWQSYIMIQIEMILLSIAQIILEAIGIARTPLLSLIALASSAFLFLGTLIIGDRRARVELYRRFHIR